ncbi:hypothetical protein HDZ31DRAFT_6843, partial [Schizophyllum fasciatum]
MSAMSMPGMFPDAKDGSPTDPDTSSSRAGNNTLIDEQWQNMVLLIGDTRRSASRRNSNLEHQLSQAQAVVHEQEDTIHELLSKLPLDNPSLTALREVREGIRSRLTHLVERLSEHGDASLSHMETLALADLNALLSERLRLMDEMHSALKNASKQAHAERKAQLEVELNGLEILLNDRVSNEKANADAWLDRRRALGESLNKLRRDAESAASPSLTPEAGPAAPASLESQVEAASKTNTFLRLTIESLKAAVSRHQGMLQDCNDVNARKERALRVTNEACASLRQEQKGMEEAAPSTIERLRKEAASAREQLRSETSHHRELQRNQEEQLASLRLKMDALREQETNAEIHYVRLKQEGTAYHQVQQPQRQGGNGEVGTSKAKRGDTGGGPRQTASRSVTGTPSPPERHHSKGKEPAHGRLPKGAFK